MILAGVSGSLQKWLYAVERQNSRYFGNMGNNDFNAYLWLFNLYSHPRLKKATRNQMLYDA